jgi:restriction system protein
MARRKKGGSPTGHPVFGTMYAPRKKEKDLFDILFGTPKEQAENLRRARAEERRKRADARREEAEARRRSAELRRAAAAQARASKQAKKELADRQTEEAQAAVGQIQDTLKHTLSVNDVVDFESLVKQLEMPLDRPEMPKVSEIGPPPDSSDRKYMPKISFFALFSAKLRQRAVEEAKERFRCAVTAWENTKNKVESHNDTLAHQHKRQLGAWQAEMESRKRRVEELRNIEITYPQKDPRAVVQYCEIVLANSEYPPAFPQQYELGYQPDSSLLVVDYLLPGTNAIPVIKQVRYVAASDELKEALLPQSAVNKLYDDLAYQIALRTIHELYEADTVGTLASIVFNGYVSTFDKATGHDIAACVLTVQADREQFLSLNLERVDAESCFENLNGVCKGRPSKLNPITPAMTTGRADTFVLTDARGDDAVSTRRAEGF